MTLPTRRVTCESRDLGEAAHIDMHKVFAAGDARSTTRTQDLDNCPPVLGLRGIMYHLEEG